MYITLPIKKSATMKTKILCFQQLMVIVWLHNTDMYKRNTVYQIGADVYTPKAIVTYSAHYIRFHCCLEL